MLIFVALAFVGLLGLVFSLLFGHDHEVEHEVSVDHDTDHDVSHDAPTVSLFSSKVIFTFIMGFGAAGSIARYNDESIISSSVWGLGSAVTLSLIMYGLMALLYKQQASSIISTKNAVGKIGNVTVTISAQSIGEVGVTIDGSYLTYTAKSKDGSEILHGRTVEVLGVAGSELIVQSKS
ncbi:MAG: NfeD family protein [Patescibacteria group bacterium]